MGSVENNDDCDDTTSLRYPGLEEVCDGIDNDCDEDTDEEFDLGEECEVGVGACAAEGVYVCGNNGAGVVCSADEPGGEAEVCDGLDNDCNGQIDDGNAVGSCRPNRADSCVECCCTFLDPLFGHIFTKKLVE